MCGLQHTPVMKFRSCCVSLFLSTSLSSCRSAERSISAGYVALKEGEAELQWTSPPASLSFPALQYPTGPMVSRLSVLYSVCLGLILSWILNRSFFCVAPVCVIAVCLRNSCLVFWGTWANRHSTCSSSCFTWLGKYYSGLREKTKELRRSYFSATVTERKDTTVMKKQIEYHPTLCLSKMFSFWYCISLTLASFSFSCCGRFHVWHVSPHICMCSHTHTCSCMCLRSHVESCQLRNAIKHVVSCVLPVLLVVQQSSNSSRQYNLYWRQPRLN